MKALTTQVTVRPTNVNSGCAAGVGAVAIGDDTFYVENGGVLSARSLTDRSVLWQRDLPESDSTLYRSIAISDGVLVVSGNSCGSTDVSGEIAVYDESDGTPRYQQSTLGLQNVEVSAGYLTLHSVTSPQQVPVTQVEKASDGSVVWYTPYSGAGYCATESWTVGNYVYMKACVDAGYRLRALQLSTGAIVWQRNGNYDVQAGDNAGSTARNLWVRNVTSGRLLDLDPRTGNRLVTLNPAAFAVLAVTSTHVFAGNNTTIYCYDTQTGRLVWSAQQFADTAAWANGMLFLDNGPVLDAATGLVITMLPTKLTIVGTGTRAVGSGTIATITGDPSRLNLLSPTPTS